MEEANGGECDQVSWEDIRGRLKLGQDPTRYEIILDLFEKRYNVASAAEALAQIPNFLGDYMVREFDYRHFCSTIGSIDDQSAEDDAMWTAHLSKHLTEDLVASASIMLRLAVAIAKAHQLEAADWQDINDACSNSVRTVPACYRLQRALPGALSLARAWRFLPDGPLEVADTSGGNPWNSEESKKHFEEMYHVPWAEIEAITGTDKEVLSSCSGCFRVSETTEVEDISLVTLEVVRVGPAPAGYPEKLLEEGDAIIWEVETALSRLLEIGFNIEADFFEVHDNSWFMSALVSIAPGWMV
jgi:hypothetical protein